MSRIVAAEFVRGNEKPHDRAARQDKHDPHVTCASTGFRAAPVFDLWPMAGKVDRRPIPDRSFLDPISPGPRVPAPRRSHDPVAGRAILFSGSHAGAGPASVY
jgi:hypothetical protein